MTTPSTLARRVRLHLYERLIACARVEPVATIARNLGVSDGDLRAALERLQAEHLLALDPQTGEPRMLHPFCCVPTDYRVESPELTWFANCAWDALSVPSLVNRAVTIVAPWSDGEGAAGTMRLRVDREGPVDPVGVVHFAVPPACLWEDIGAS